MKKNFRSMTFYTVYEKDVKNKTLFRELLARDKEKTIPFITLIKGNKEHEKLIKLLDLDFNCSTSKDFLSNNHCYLGGFTKDNGKIISYHTKTKYCFYRKDGILEVVPVNRG